MQIDLLTALSDREFGIVSQFGGMEGEYDVFTGGLLLEGNQWQRRPQLHLLQSKFFRL